MHTTFSKDHRLQVASPVGEVLQSIADQELDFAASQIAALPHGQEDSVHQCRKSIKRLRALIRVGVAVPGTQPRPLERPLRDAARVLAPIRDATEAARTLGRLLDSYPQLKSLKGIDGISVAAIDADVSANKVLARLEKVRSRLPAFFSANRAWTFVTVATGIEATYVRASTHMYRFSRKHREKSAHAWRKEVQCLGNQLNIINPLCPEFLSGSLRTLSRLADLLGEHNDLAVLRARLKADRMKLSQETRKALRTVARTRQRQLRTQALALGRDFFAQSPDEFRNSLLAECSDSVA